MKSDHNSKRKYPPRQSSSKNVSRSSSSALGGDSSSSSSRLRSAGSVTKTSRESQSSSESSLETNSQHRYTSSSINYSQPKPREITVNVTTIMGKIIKIQIQTFNTVGQLKELISDEAGISPESQMLVWCGKQLNDDSQVLKSLNIQDQSNLQLVLKMAGGPGPPIQMKRLSQEEDQVVFLLCKQNQELYVLEVHLKENEKPRTITKHHLRLQSPSYGKKLLEFLGSNEFFDISDLCELQIDLETPEEYESANEYHEDFENLSTGGAGTESRPLSAKSSFSYVSTAKSSSRPDSGSSQPSTISTGSFESLLWENENYLTDQLLGEPTIARSIRPATAISLMRLPSGSRPMVIIPKARPSTAEQWVDGFKSHMKSNDHLFEEQNFFHTSSSSITIQSPDPPRENTTSPIDRFEALHLRQSSSMSLPKSKQQSKVPIAKKRTPMKVATPKKYPSVFVQKDQHILQFTSKSRQPSRKSAPRKSIATPIKVTIQKRQCCTQCQKKLGPAQTFTCKCEKQFCAQHRYSDRHMCTYDYKTPAKVALAQNNPLIKGEKLLRL